MNKLKNFLHMNNSIKLNIIHARGQFTISANEKSSFYDIKKLIAHKFEIQISSIVLLLGSSRKRIEFSDSVLLNNTGIRSGETIIVENKQSSLRRLNSSTFKSSNTKFQQTPDHNGLIMIKRVIPADNSCLFNSVAYALENKSRDSASFLRQIVASYIASDPVKYSEVFLDRPNISYQKWIMDPLNWGGAIEMEILAMHYSTEICALDIQNFSTNIFGCEQGFKSRIYVLYDGVHYDVVAKNISEDMPESMDVTIFHPKDSVAFDGVMMLAQELNHRARETVNFERGVCSPKAFIEKGGQIFKKQNNPYKFSEIAP